jgi:putative nucleotidyltransferase with HDIG domain
VARALNADRTQIQALEAAALLHDLGKLAVPEHILNKPGPLSPAEFDEMKKHASVGASILSAIDFPFPVVPIVRHHHENWDGSGYPDELKGDQIPLGARILAIVDCYDALTTDRPYRRRMADEDALEIIRSRSGRMYDPHLVDVFVAMTRTLPAENEPTEAEIASPLRSLMARALDAPGIKLKSATPSAAKRFRRDRVSHFLKTVEGLGWHEAGEAVAAFVPNAVPDSVAVLFRFDPDRHQLVVAGTHRALDVRVPEKIALGRGVTGWVAANKRPLANADAELDLGDVAGLIRPPLRLCLSVPLVQNGELAGALTAYSPYGFSEMDRRVIEWIGEELPAAMLGAPEQTLERMHSTVA